ncbi:GNAT family N-acetyltransferase [Rossellomorea sp. SC111]|uniref:GNAT family N-acetyltransferase n=1 Tax=Rossellomorea sp. SC111 TaxID=2968985 RepID=UPI00215ABAA4|nr:GNAT family N-acetyltransferase [Rossellomorea sp. SC111]MCR8847527.1 GNAT family N-acetyltransferase [Rossellomorea sp. SC111]
MNRIEISRPNSRDKNELIQFFSTVIQDTFAKEGISSFHEDLKNEIETKCTYLQSDYDSNGTERYFLIAKDGQTIVGTIEYGHSSELINRTTNGALMDVYEIGTVFVHPGYQRRGIGSLLLNTMLLTFLNRGIAEFCMDSGYATAQTVWTRKLGDPDYWLKNYWGEDSDHMIWKRKVKDVPIIFRENLHWENSGGSYETTNDHL